MFYIKKIENNYLIGTSEEIAFRNKATIIKKLNDFLEELYSSYSSIIINDSKCISINYGYKIKTKDDVITDSQNRTRNYKIYNIKIVTSIFKTEQDAVIYLEGLINDIIMKLKDEDYDISDSIDALDIID